MFGELLDKLALTLSPGWGARRIEMRRYASGLKASSGQHASMQKMLGGRTGGYEAGKPDRLKGYATTSPHENDIPRAQVARLRSRSWNLYRNNPQARKICRSLGAKVVGRGLSPQPQSTMNDGTPFVEFRRRARVVFSEFSKECDFRGKPGCGGQDFTSQCKTALRGTMLSGGVLYQFHHLNQSEQRKRGLYLPLQVQLLHIDRLDESKHGNNWYYGVKLDANGRLEGFQVLVGGAKSSSNQSEFVSAEQMRHLFAEEDIDQIIGSPWFNAALLTMDDRRGYEYAELTAAEMGACFVALYRRSAGHAGNFGLQGGGNNDRDLTDADGNPVTRLQPGMLLDGGASGDLQLLNPNRPNSNAGEFLGHLIGGEAVSVPGTKKSTLTGDYRNSSFSSERSADNDAWPEIEELQDWFAVGFCQPIYEEVIASAVVAGKFSDIAGFSAADFNERKREYLKTNWQGPVARSINPKDDAEAARQRIKNGTSSPQREAAKLGCDWRELRQEIREFMDYDAELQINENLTYEALGIEQVDQPEQPAEPTEGAQDAAFNRISTVCLNSA